MADDFKKLAQAELTTIGSPVTLVTAGATAQIIVRHIRAVNQDTGQSIALKMWQTGTTNADIILPSADISAGGWAEFEGTIILDPNEVLYASCENPTTGASTADITITVYGLEMTP